MSDLCVHISACTWLRLMHVVFDFWITNRNVAHMYSLYDNKIEDAGAQSLAKGLQCYTNLQKLK